MCKTKFCRKLARQSGLCYSCIKRIYKENNPERYAYSVLKNNAKRRGKTFTITYEYFLTVVEASGYMQNRGKASDSLHIDRIDESKGYEPGNIQVLTNRDNTHKYLSYHYDEKGKPTNFKTKTRKTEPEQDYPF